MGDLEEAKQILGETHSILDQRNIRHANLSIVQGNIEKVQMLLENMKDGEAERPFNECPECDYLEGHDDICECCENGSNQYVSEPTEERKKEED